MLDNVEINNLDDLLEVLDELYLKTQESLGDDSQALPVLEHALNEVNDLILQEADE